MQDEQPDLLELAAPQDLHLSQDLRLSQDLPFSQDNFGDYFSSSLEALSDDALVTQLGGPLFEQIQENTFDLEPIVYSAMPQVAIVAAPASGANIASSCPPASNNWDGDYHFNIYFEPQEKEKGLTWMYSEERDKLYVTKDLPCCINFMTSSVPPDGCKIRATAVYSQPQHSKDAVQRCYNHQIEDQRKGVISAEHLIRCDNPGACYETDAITGHMSVVVPYESPSRGYEYSLYVFKFACYCSCLNRRPIKLIFTLEYGDIPVGRRSLDVKICACPTRDCRNDDKQSAIDDDKGKITSSKVRTHTRKRRIQDLSSVTPPVHATSKSSSSSKKKFVTKEQLSSAVNNVMGGPSYSFYTDIPSQLPAIIDRPDSCSSSSRDNFPGEYRFGVQFESEKSRRVPYVYSAERDKLYVTRGASCPIRFLTNKDVPENVRVRATAVFAQPEHASEVVKPCYNCQLEVNKDVVYPNHLVCCEFDAAFYETEGRNGHHSVIIPFESSLNGTDYSEYIFKFVCYGSCSGGLNRRPIKVVFSLERGEEIVGQRSLNVKICACPIRDCRNDDNQRVVEDQSPRISGSSNTPSEGSISSHFMDIFRSISKVTGQKVKLPRNVAKKSGPFVMTIFNRDEYDFLRQMLRLRELIRSIDVLITIQNDGPTIKEETSDSTDGFN